MKTSYNTNTTPTDSTPFRKRVFRHLKNKLSGFVIAAMLLIPISTVYFWKKEYEEKGEQAV
jgi:transposase